MKRLLITGGTGLIGRELLELLSKSNEYEYWLISHSLDENVEKHIIRCDIKEEIKTDKFPKSVDCIIHLAQADNHSSFPENSKQIFDVNAGGILNLLNLAVKLNVKRFIFASSGGVYSETNSEISEETLINNKNDLGFYLNTKIISEIIAQNYKKYFDIVTLRIFFAYGYGQKDNMLFQRLIQSVKNGNRVTINSKNGIYMNPIYSSDVAKYIYKLINETSSDEYNIAGKEIIELGEIARMIGRILGIKPEIVYQDNIQKNIVAKTDKLYNRFGEPEISIRDGLIKMLNCNIC